MRIRSIKTSLEQIVTTEDWAKMKGRGDARKFVIISKDSKRPEVPKAVKKAVKKTERIVTEVPRKETLAAPKEDLMD